MGAAKSICGKKSSETEPLKDETDIVEVEEGEEGENTVPIGVNDARGTFMKSVTLTKDNSSKVMLSMKVVDLLKPDSVYCIIYSRFQNDPGWVQIGMTEFNEIEAMKVSFAKTVELKFFMERHRLLRFEVFKCRDTVFLEDLKHQKFLGCCETSLIALMMARSRETGWSVTELFHPKKGNAPQGKMCVWAEEDFALKQHISFNLQAVSLATSDMFKGRPDAYCNLQREHPKKKTAYQNVLRTEVCRKQKNPEWERLELDTPQLWPQDTTTPVRVEVKDWFRVAPDRMIGESWLEYEDITKAFLDSKPLVMPIFKTGSKKHAKKIQGSRKRRTATTVAATAEAEEMGMKKYMLGSFIQLEEAAVLRRYSFLDFVRGGMELRLMVAIDFTRSNGEPFEERSLHRIDPNDPEKPNTYVNVIKALGGIMGSYDSDNRYPVYGFGAKVPPTKTFASDAFALTGDFFDPEVEGIGGIVDAYMRACRVVSFNGPTRLSSVTELAHALAEPYAKCQEKTDLDMAFYVMVIITDGAVADDDKQRFVKALQSIENVPSCVVVVGIGDEDFSFLEGLTREVRESRRLAGASEEELKTREIVKFVHFGGSKTTAEEMQAKSAEALSQVPREVVGFYHTNGIKPRNLDAHEDDVGRPKAPPEDPLGIKKKKKGEKGAAVEPASGAASRAGTNRSGTRSGTNRSGARSATKGSGASGSRMGSKETEKTEASDAEAHENYQKMVKKEEAKRKRIMSRLPPHIQDAREILRKQAVGLGYDKFQVMRALRDGCPANNLEMLVDCVVNSGYGKNPSFKDLAERAFDTKISSNLTDLLDQETAKTMITEAQELLNCDRVSLFVHDLRVNKLKLYSANLAVTITLPMGQGIAGWVFDERVTVNIPNCYNDYRFDRITDTKFGYLTRSMLCTPVLDGNDKPVGVLQAINKLAVGVDKTRADRYMEAVIFSKSDEATLEQLAKSLHETLDRGHVDAVALQGILASAAVLKDMESDLSRLMGQDSISFFLTSLKFILRCDRVSLFVYDKAAEDLMLYASNLPGAGHGMGIRLKPGLGIAGMVFQDKDMVTIDNCYEDSRFDPSFDKKMKYHTTSVCVACVLDGHSESVGVVQAINKISPHIEPTAEEAFMQAVPFKADDEKVLAYAAEQLGKGMQRGRVDCEYIKDFLEQSATLRKGRHHLPVHLLIPEKLSGSATPCSRLAGSPSRGSASPTSPLSPKSTGSWGANLGSRPPSRGEDVGSKRHGAEPEYVEEVCVVCQIEPATMVCQPCAHASTCPQCAPQVGGKCPNCKATVQAVQRLRPMSPLASRRGSSSSIDAAADATAAASAAVAARGRPGSPDSPKAARGRPDSPMKSANSHRL